MKNKTTTFYVVVPEGDIEKVLTHTNSANDNSIPNLGMFDSLEGAKNELDDGDVILQIQMTATKIYKRSTTLKAETIK